MSKIEVGPGYDTLAKMMEAEAVFQVRRYKDFGRFTVEMDDGSIGGGSTVREAIEAAKLEAVAA